jgi:hypothetical protein
MWCRGPALTGVSRGGVGCCALMRGSITCSTSKAGSSSRVDDVHSGTSIYQQVWIKVENKECFHLRSSLPESGKVIKA